MPHNDCDVNRSKYIIPLRYFLKYTVLNIFLISAIEAKYCCKNCVCVNESSLNENYIACSNTYFNIKTQEEKIYLNCKSVNYLEDMDVDNYVCNDTKSVEISSCNISNKLKSILNQIGIRAAEDLEIKNNNQHSIILSQDFFEDFKMIKKLIIRGSHLMMKGENILTDVLNLTSITISNVNNFINVSHGFLSNLIMLRNVSLYDLNLISLPENMFLNSVNIERIYLSNNNLNYLEKNIFKDLSNLKELHLYKNNFVSLPEDIFLTLKHLSFLSLSHSNLSNLPNGLFNNLENLIKLYIDSNQITFKDNKDIFNKLGNLKTLNLSNNHIQNLYGRVLTEGSINGIEELYLSNNSITTIDTFFQSIGNLKILDLSRNYITHIDKYFFSSTSKHNLEINLSFNQISIVEMKDLEINKESYIFKEISLLLEGNAIACNSSNFNLIRYFKKQLDTTYFKKIVIDSNTLKCSSPDEYFGLNVNEIDPKQLTNPVVDSNCPNICTCSQRIWDNGLVLNCSGKILNKYEEFKNIEFKYPYTELIMSNNDLTSSPVPNSDIFQNITKLYLDGNKITDLGWLPPHLEILDLRRNNLSRMSNHALGALKNLSKSLVQIFLQDNPWDCDCTNETKNFRDFLIMNSNLMSPTSNIICKGNKIPLINLKDSDLCQPHRKLIIIIFAIILPCVVGIALLVAMYTRHRYLFRIWMFKNKLTRRLVTETHIEENKLYDAFISYSQLDEDFVINDLITVLESGSNPYKLCLHGRDWTAGEMIVDNIVSAVEESKRTIIVLSDNFLKSRWGILEFRIAHSRASREGLNRVITVIYGDVDMENLDEELRNYLKTNTYVKWKDPWFWHKLKYALPHSVCQTQYAA